MPRLTPAELDAKKALLTVSSGGRLEVNGVKLFKLPSVRKQIEALRKQEAR